MQSSVSEAGGLKQSKTNNLKQYVRNGKTLCNTSRCKILYLSMERKYLGKYAPFLVEL